MKKIQKCISIIFAIVMLTLVGCSSIPNDPSDGSVFLAPTLSKPPPSPSLSIDYCCHDTPNPLEESHNISNITTEDLDQLLGQWGTNIAVHFECINSGFTYERNADREFFGASVSKATLALLLYKMADTGEIDLDQTMRAQANHARHGSMNVGDIISIRRLIAINLYQSDNGATLMLRDHLGNGNATAGTRRYRQFVESIGGDPSLVRGVIMDSILTAREMALFARAIHEYIEGDNPNSEEFRTHLTNNAHLFLFRESDVTVGSKTGWYGGFLNDMAIVYLENRPFILTMMTTGRTSNVRPDTSNISQQDRADFALISETFLDFQLGRRVPSVPNVR